MSSSNRSLLSSIESALQAEPPSVARSGSLRLHTLFSIPRQVKTLYPLAHIHPTDLDKSRQRAPISAYLEQIFVTASWQDAADQADASSNSSAPILILALELYLYTIPAHGSAVLYISKLDTSGYGPASIPSAVRETLSRDVFGSASGSKGKAFGNTLTATITSAATQHFTTFQHWDSPSDNSSEKGKALINHVAVHILARSQRAYLFPSSPENKNKKVLSDGGLIKWWRDVMSHVTVQSRLAHPKQDEAATQSAEDINTRAFYLIPGYNKLESHPLVPIVQQQNVSSSVRQSLLLSSNWVYGHPYSPAGADCSTENLPPLPLHWQRSSFIQQSRSTSSQPETNPESSKYDPVAVQTVPTLMPHFSDDPKTRFLDEMARDAHEHAGWKRKAPGTTKDSVNNKDASDKPSAHDKNQIESVSQPDTKRARTEDDGPSTDDVPANKVLVQSSTASGPPLVAIRASMRERASLDDLPVDEFWERMGFRQECCSGNAVGVIVCLFTRRPRASPATPTAEDAATTVVERQPFSIPHKVLSDLVFNRLMRDVCEWHKLNTAIDLTRSWFAGVDREVRRKGGITQFQPQIDATPSTDGANDALPESGFVGKGQLWMDIDLVGPSQALLDKAKQEQKAKDASTTPSTAGGPSASAATGAANVLSVKRKKKPPTQ